MIQDLQQMIGSLGVDCREMTPKSKLGEPGIGLDSLEIVEFAGMIGKKYGIKLPPMCFSKTSTIEQVLASLEQYKSGKQPRGPFEGKVIASLAMECSPEIAFNAIYEMDKWPQLLPHVKRIETLYNDGVYQEFLMDVQSDTGLIQVRSIRRCIKDEGITFFQPKPPKFLKHHCGGWSFEKNGTGCLVTTWHEWNVEQAKAREVFASDDDKVLQAKASDLLLSHAQFALTTWKKLLEVV